MRIMTMAAIAVLSTATQAALGQDRPTYFRHLQDAVRLPVSNAFTCIMTLSVHCGKLPKSQLRPAGSFFGDFRKPSGVRNSSRERTVCF